MRLSALDRKILNYLQRDIPIVSAPFQIIAKRLCITESLLLKKIRQFQRSGIIRRFSGHLNHRKLGFVGSLVALKIPRTKLSEVVNKLTAYPEVTHCYLREGEFNLWLIFLTLRKEKLERFLRSLTRKFGRRNILILKTKRQFKLMTNIKI